MYWLQRRSEFPLDPLEITRYDELAMFGHFDLAVLRDIDPVDLVPQASSRPFSGRVWETTGTTGRPCRVLYTDARARHYSAWRVWGLRLAGFLPGRTWLYACPSGPHIAGQGADEIAQLYDSTVYTIDLDPRWILCLIRSSRLAELNRYVDHIVDQIADVFEDRTVDYLETAPAVLNAVIDRRPELVSRLAGVRLGGTQVTPSMYRKFEDALDGGIIGTTYGNTFGYAMGLPTEERGAMMPYIAGYPQITVTVVDRDDPQRIVDQGEVGQVRMTVLHDDLFLPGILERDQAVRYRTSGDWPCELVANMRPLQPSLTTSIGRY